MKPVVSQRYWALDAMRGVAAAVVVLGHLNPSSALSSHLAVDFFFQLSGFVIAGAYSDKLNQGMKFTKFVNVRLKRLYPLFFTGIFIGLLRIIILKFLRIHYYNLYDVVFSFICNVFFIPSPSHFFIGSAMQGLFPIDGPAWSMFWEIGINIVFAILFVHLRIKHLISIIILAFVFLFIAAVDFGSLNIGWEWTSWAGGIPRVTFGFTLGILMQRLLSGVPRKANWMVVLPMVILVSCLIAPVRGHWHVPYDLLFCCVVSPLLILAGILFEAPARLVPVCAWLGYASYPVYIIHRGIVGLYEPIIAHLHVHAALSALIFLPFITLLSVGISLAIDHLMRRSSRAKQAEMVEAVSARAL